MSVLNPRDRLISFRVSEEEYERLRAASGAQGARSLSDFVRSGICWIAGNSNRGLLDLIAASHPLTPGPGRRGIDSAAGEGHRRDPVTALEDRLDSLAHEVQDLSRQLRRQPPAREVDADTPEAVAVNAGPR